MTDAPEVSVVMPCLNEAETVAVCVRKARECLGKAGVSHEVLVADNGSTDGSQELARRAGARVVDVAEKGYGSALMGGFRAARGRYVIMGDADDSYDFSDLMPFVEALRAGADLAMGNRFKGGILPGAMPPLHRYLGNPVLTGIGRLFFGSPCGDFHCGLRGFHRERLLALDLATTGMEFASEMVVKASLHGLRVVEVPTKLHPAGRTRPPHLRSWRDGWRHLRFLLIYAPRWLFFYPGLLLMAAGTAFGAWLMPGRRYVAGAALDIHTLLFAALMVLIGYQAVIFSVFTKVFAARAGLVPMDERIERLHRSFTLEAGLLLGAAMMLAGLGGAAWAIRGWQQAGFGELEASVTMRSVIPAVTFLAMGCQTALASFFLSVLGLKSRSLR